MFHSVLFDVNVEFMIRTIYLENHAHAIKAVATTKRQFAQAGPHSMASNNNFDESVQSFISGRFAVDSFGFLICRVVPFSIVVIVIVFQPLIQNDGLNGLATATE